MSILIVDDFEEQRELLAATLKQAGYRSLMFADSAKSALQQLGIGSPATPSAHVDIILMDLHMPDMDGLEACRLIRSDERLEHLPVIVVTAKAQSIDKVLGLHIAKVDDYIAKPFSPQDLMNSVEKVLNKTKA